MCERGEKEIQNKNDMKKYQLYRPLLYQDRRSIDEFIKEDPMWEELYRLYLQMRRQYHTKINSLKTFNTVRFFCVCVMTDPHPEDNFEENYLEPLTKISNVDADICCALAYVVLKLMKNPPTQVSYFLPELEAQLESGQYEFKTEQDETDMAFDFVDGKKADNKLESWQVDLWPHPANISLLPLDKKWWNDVTVGFSMDDLYCMLNFWPDNSNKLMVLERMRQAGLPEHQYVEIRSEIMTLDEEDETAEFQEEFMPFAIEIYEVWQEYRRAQNAYIQLQMPEMALQAAQDGEKEEHAVSQDAVEAFLNGIKAVSEKAEKSDLLLADTLIAKAQLEKTVTATAQEVKRLLKENQALATAKEQLESQNKTLQAELKALRTKNSKPAAGTPSDLKALASLVDKALELGDEKSLKELLVCLTTMEEAERAKAQAKRVEQRLKELKAPVPHTQYNYYEGASHISGNQIKGVSIGTTPANRTLPQE